MRAARRVAGNTGVVLFGKLLGAGLNIVIFLQLIHSLSAAEYGHYTFVFVYIGIFSVVAEMGMSSILVREMARNRERAGEILGTGIFLKVILAIFSFAAALVLLPVVKPDDYLFRLVFILGWQLLSYPLLTCVNTFQLELKMVYPTTSDLVRNAIYLAGVWYVLRTPGLGLPHLFALAVITSFLVAIVLYVLSQRYVKIRLRYRGELARLLIVAALPLGVSKLAIMFYYRVDTLMLLPMKGAEAVGYYGSAVKVAEAFNLIPGALMVSVYPFLARFWHDERGKFLEATELSLRTLLALALPVGIMGSLFASQIVALIGAYEPAAASLVYLVWAEVFIFLNLVLYNVLNAMNQERWNLWTTLLMLAGNVTLNLALIPRYSHPGASLATLLTEVLGFVMLGLLTLKLVNSHLKIGHLLRILFAGAAVAGALWFAVHQMTVSVPWALALMALGSAAYAGALYLLKVIDVREIRSLLAISKGEDR